MSRLHFIQPYSFQLDIGGAYNNHIKLLPDNSWICITDQDTLKFPGFANRVLEVINTIDENTIFTCMTNRLAKGNPQVLEALYDEGNINEHIEASELLWNTYKTALEDAKVIAGVCMVFHKSIWSEIGGFEPNNIRFDTIFTAKCKNAGKQLKIAIGLYIFHLYRWHSKNPSHDIKHLIK